VYWSDVEVFIGDDEVFIGWCFDVVEVFIGDDAEFLLVGDDEVLMLLKFLLVMTRNFYWLVMTKFEVFIGDNAKFLLVGDDEILMLKF